MSFYGRLGIGLSILVLASCGVEPQVYREQANNDVSASSIRLFSMSREQYDNLFFERILALGVLSSESKQQTIAIDFDANSIGKGVNAGQSFFLCSSDAQLSGMSLTEATRTAIMENVSSELSLAMPSLSLTVVDARDISLDPATYSVIALTTSAQDLGCNGSGYERYTGFAVQDPGNINHHDMGIAFVGSVTSADRLSKIIIETALPILGYEANKTQLKALSLAEETPEGLTTIAGFAHLLEDIDDDVAFDASKLYSKINALFPGQSAGLTVASAELSIASKIGGLKGLERILGVYALATGAAPNMEQFAGIDFSKLNFKEIAVIVGKCIALFASVASGGIGVLLSAAAIATVLDVIDFFKDLFSGATPVTALAHYPGTEVPNFGAMLSLDSYETLPLLFKSLDGHADVLFQNYKGNLRQELASLLKMAYGQAYKATK